MQKALPPALARLRARILRRLRRWMRDDPEEVRRQIAELYAEDTDTALPEPLPNPALIPAREERAVRASLRALCSSAGVALYSDTRGGQQV